MQHNVRGCNQVGLLIAGEGEGNSRQSCTTPAESIRLCCESSRCGQQTMQAIQGTAICP